MRCSYNEEMRSETRNSRSLTFSQHTLTHSKGSVALQSAEEGCEPVLEWSQFQSLMHAGWWAVMTMTTVGYGDITPKTFSGALIGYLTMLIGVLSVALPISVLSSTFGKKYSAYETDQVCRE